MNTQPERTSQLQSSAHEPLGPIYWATLDHLSAQFVPVSTRPPAQCLYAGVVEGGGGHEFILGYYRWQLRLRVSPERDLAKPAVVVAVAMREAGLLSRAVHGSWTEVLRQSFETPPSESVIGHLVVELDRRLRDLPEVQRWTLGTRKAH